MRVDGGSTYYFPATPEQSAVVGPGGDNKEDGPDVECDGIQLELTALSLLTECGDPNPVGAQGWFASAVLSSLLLLDWRHPLLRSDLTRLVDSAPSRNNGRPRTVLELGSGTISLAGMAMAWILAQQQQRNQNQSQQEREDRENAHWTSRVILTDNDSQCLDQLQINAETVRNGLQKHFNTVTYDTQSLPDLQVQPLDWQHYDQTQSVLDVENHGTIDLILGAALVYTADGAGICSRQVAKILRKNPQTVLRLAQYPRDGWLHVFKIELQRQCSDHNRLSLQTFDPTEIHPNVHTLAQRLMPRARGAQFDLEFIKVIRVSLNDAE
jgi:hypothetical protein